MVRQRRPRRPRSSRRTAASPRRGYSGQPAARASSPASEGGLTLGRIASGAGPQWPPTAHSDDKSGAPPPARGPPVDAARPCMLLLIRLRGRGAVARCWGGAKASQKGSVARMVDGGWPRSPPSTEERPRQPVAMYFGGLHDLAREPFHIQPHRFFILDQPEVIITSHP